MNPEDLVDSRSRQKDSPSDADRFDSGHLPRFLDLPVERSARGPANTSEFVEAHDCRRARGYVWFLHGPVHNTLNYIVISIDLQHDLVYHIRSVSVSKYPSVMSRQPDIYEFTWTVPDAGYEIFSTNELPPKRRPSEEERFLVERLVDDSWITRYPPLITQTGLFKEFASLHPASEEEIVKFAGKYGWLGGPMQVPVFRFKPGESRIPLPSINPMRQLVGERTTAWEADVATMEHLIRLWDAATKGDQATLAEFLTWDANGDGVRYVGILGHTMIATINYREKFFSNLNAGELVRPTLDFVRTRVNKLLENRGITNRLLWDPNYRRQRVHIVPTSLVAALWLQFAKAIEGDKEYRQCEQCNRWFEVAAEKREDAKFCQNACRSKAYRERQKTARKLRGEGVAVREIARRLDSDTKTITRWIKT